MMPRIRVALVLFMATACWAIVAVFSQDGWPLRMLEVGVSATFAFLGLVVLCGPSRVRHWLRVGC